MGVEIIEEICRNNEDAKNAGRLAGSVKRFFHWQVLLALRFPQFQVAKLARWLCTIFFLEDGCDCRTNIFQERCSKEIYFSLLFLH